LSIQVTENYSLLRSLSKSQQSFRVIPSVAPLMLKFSSLKCLRTKRRPRVKVTCWIPKRHSNSFDAPQWEDQMQRAQIKSLEWYEEQASQRRYFYHVQLSGMLFLEDMTPKNILVV